STEEARLGVRFRNDPLIGNSSGSSVQGIDALGWSNIQIDSNLTGITVSKCSGNVSSSSPIVVRQHRGSVTFSAGASGSLVSNSILSNLYLDTVNVAASHCVITSNFRSEPST